MRENSGRPGRVAKKVQAFLLALVAVFAFTAVSATSANAAQKLKLTFDDSWIKVDSLASLGGGTFHAIDPEDENPITMALEGDLTNDGAFTAPKAAFDFPTQTIDTGIPSIGQIDLIIEAVQDISGQYNETTGGFTAQLPLRLEVNAPGLGMACEISPLNIPVATSGTKDFGTVSEPNNLSGVPYTNEGGSLLGSWTDVGVDDVKDIEPTEPGTCQALIGGLIGGEDASFDGSIWLSGTREVTGVKDCPAGQVGTFPDCVDEKCPTGQVGTPPNCQNEALPPKVGALTITKKVTVKKGKKAKVKITVKNTGGKTLTGKIALKSSNKQVKAPKTVAVSVGAGKSVTKTVTISATKKAKGKANLTASIGGKKAVAKVTVKK
jgi:hypothetical protein